MTRALALALFVITGASVCSTGAPEPNPAWQTVYADEDWYRERAEPERKLVGTLRPREVVYGPNARTALRYTLVMSDGALAVYAPTDALDRHVNKLVAIRGKEVRLDETELWPGAIRAAK
jgi:hypothetical protein